MTAIITRQMLTDAGVCSEQLAQFDCMFPEGDANVTVVGTERLAFVFDWQSAAPLLDNEERDGFMRFCLAASTKHGRSRLSSWCESKRLDTDAAWAEHERAGLKSWTDYKRSVAAAWAAAYIATCKRRQGQ